jgi:predicted nucleic acid-binding protein
MNFVVDTSVIIAVIANEPEKSAIIAHTQGAELLAPRSLHWEVGNAFSAMLKRGRITLEQAKAAVDIYEQISLNVVDINLSQALELASRLNIYAYDAYIIACALNQSSPLLTLDGGLSYAAKAAGVTVVEVNRSDADVS